MALPAGRVSPARCAWTEGLEAAGGRWGAPGRAIPSERGLRLRHASPESIFRQRFETPPPPHPWTAVQYGGDWGLGVFTKA